MGGANSAIDGRPLRGRQVNLNRLGGADIFHHLVRTIIYLKLRMEDAILNWVAFVVSKEKCENSHRTVFRGND